MVTAIKPANACMSATGVPPPPSLTHHRDRVRYVRVDGDKIETCPISGTIRRGKDPVEDAAQVLELLNSKKDESELTMCTGV